MKYIVEKVRWVGSILHDVTLKRIMSASEQSSLDDILRLIKARRIEEVKIGFGGSNVVTCKIHALRLEKALKRNNRSLTSFVIGPGIYDPEVIAIIFTSISRHCQLENFKFISDVWVPEGLLRGVLLSQSSLKSFSVRSITVKRRSPVTGKFCCDAGACVRKVKLQSDVGKTTTSNTVCCHPIRKGNHTKVNVLCNELNVRASAAFPSSTTTSSVCDHNVVPRVIVPIIYSSHVRKLSKLVLADCNICDKQAILLAEAITARGGIEELSLRMNHRLSPKGVTVICKAPVRSHLDLSLCGFQQKHALAVAEGVAARTRSLGKLSLCANFEIGTFGLLQLLSSTVCAKLKVLDVSYCELDSFTTCLILNALNMLNGSTSVIREVYMHGAKVNKAIVSNALSTLLGNRQAPMLRVIDLSDPRDRTKVMSAKQFRAILEGIRGNFHIEELKIHYIRSFSEETLAWNDIQCYLDMNRSGRRYLIKNPPQIPMTRTILPSTLEVSKSKRKLNELTLESLTYIACSKGEEEDDEDDWMQILAKAGQYDNMNVLYWIFRHGVENFIAHRR